jgi:hypothetical protein
MEILKQQQPILHRGSSVELFHGKPENSISKPAMFSKGTYKPLYNNDCYIASVNTKRDWLICSHVALDKCNVSHPGNK